MPTSKTRLNSPDRPAPTRGITAGRGRQENRLGAPCGRAATASAFDQLVGVIVVTRAPVDILVSQLLSAEI
jgi:hypothetical protein